MEYRLTNVFENGKGCPIDGYSGQEIRSIMDCVNVLFRPAPNVEYWFEVDDDGKANPYQADSWCSSLSVRCYMPTEGGGQTQIPIPKEYAFMVNRRVSIKPAQVGLVPWPEVVEVSLVCL